MRRSTRFTTVGSIPPHLYTRAFALHQKCMCTRRLSKPTPLLRNVSHASSEWNGVEKIERSGEAAEHTPAVKYKCRKLVLLRNVSLVCTFDAFVSLSSPPHRFTCTCGMKWCGEDAFVSLLALAPVVHVHVKRCGPPHHLTVLLIFLYTSTLILQQWSVQNRKFLFSQKNRAYGPQDFAPVVSYGA